jgi:hypothetical protein
MNLKKILRTTYSSNCRSYLHGSYICWHIGETRDVKSLIIYGILESYSFMSGISLVRTTKDESCTLLYLDS